MTVVFSGIGADTTNFGALGRLDTNGDFDYIPIPEKTRETTETTTFGSVQLRTREANAASLSDRIRPRPLLDSEFVVRDDSVAEWPLHHDPNFDALTYGEHRTTGYVSRLAELEADDIVAFYAGLRDEIHERAHRYLIGYFTVEKVTVLSPDCPPSDRLDGLRNHPHNAHAKRARSDRPYLDEKTVVIVDGRTPGGLFDHTPLRLSEYVTNAGGAGTYRLREDVVELFALEDGRRNMSYKPAYRSELDSDRFRSIVGVPGDRSRDTTVIERRLSDAQ